MTELLLKCFVKDHKNTHDPSVRAAIGKLAGMTGMLCNLLLAAGKLVLGLLLSSVSVTADGVNNLTDGASSLVMFLGFRMARHPADREHPYGHARYEYLSGLAVAALILVMGGELVKTSVGRIFAPVAGEIGPVSMAILAATALVKLWMAVFYTKLGRKVGSLSLLAAAADSRNDILATGAVLLGCGAQYFAHIQVDGYVGLVLALFIIYSGGKLLCTTASPLLGQRADRELTERLRGLILAREQVLGIHDLLIHDYGPGQCYASVHVELSAEADPLYCHDIIDEIEWQVLQELNVHLVIHYDPVVQNDAEQNEMLQTVARLLYDMDPRLSIHDFRLVRGAAQTKLVFDLTVPYDMADGHSRIKERLDSALRARELSYLTVIRFDAEA